MALDSDRAYPDRRGHGLPRRRSAPTASPSLPITTPNDMRIFRSPPPRSAAGVHVISDKPATATLGEALALQRHVAASHALYAMTLHLHRLSRWFARRARAPRVATLGRMLPGPCRISARLAGRSGRAWRQQTGGLARLIPPARASAAAFRTISVSMPSALPKICIGRADRPSARRSRRGCAGPPDRRRCDAAASASRVVRAGLSWRRRSRRARATTCASESGASAADCSGRMPTASISICAGPDRPDEIVSLPAGTSGWVRLPLARRGCLAAIPKGFIEAFANIYRDFAGAIRHTTTPIAQTPLCGTRRRCARACRFVDAALRSSAQGGTWATGRRNRAE